MLETLDGYCQRLTIEVGTHGIDAIESFDDPAHLVIGFRSPSGEWAIGVHYIRVAFGSLGARLGPPFKREVLARLLGDRLRVAIVQGELIWATQKGET